MSVKWSEIKDNISTGDVLLFHGEDSLFSRFIELVTWSEYSHCGVIVKPPITFTTPPLDADKHYLFQSGKPNTPQPESPHNELTGVQFTEIEETCEKYQGKVYYRKLWCGGIPESKRHTILSELHQKIHNHPYDKDVIDWVSAFVDYPIQPTTSRFWCSALLGY